MSNLLNRLVMLFPLPKLDNILRDVHDTLARLEQSVKVHAVAAEKQAAAAAKALAKKAESEAHIEQAETVVRNVRALLGKKD